METPDPPEAVEPIAASAHHSRPVPAFGIGEGVFQTASLGKYSCCTEYSAPDVIYDRRYVSDFAIIDTPVNPGCTSQDRWETPNPTDTVRPHAVHSLQSRPGPVFRPGDGVSQPALPGKYHCYDGISSSDGLSHSSNTALSTTATSALGRIYDGFLEAEAESSEEPGRMLERTREAPDPSDPVEPYVVPESPSRPGPVVGIGEGVFQPAASGEYSSSIVSSLPQDSSPSSDSRLRVYYQNVRGLRTKIDDFFLAATECDYDIVVLTESWLDDRIQSPQLFGNSFTVFRNDRNALNSTKTRGGGVLIAVSNHFDCCLEPTVVCNTLEQLWVRLTVRNKVVCVGVLYLPPDRKNEINSIQNHIDSIGSIVSRLGMHDIFIQFGDYNQPGLTWISADAGGLEIDPRRTVFSSSSSCLVDGFHLHGLTQVNPVPNANARFLDLVLVNDVVLPSCAVTVADELLTGLDTAHPALEMSVNMPTPPVAEQWVDLQSYNFRKADYAALEEAISRVDWHFLESASSIDVAVDYFQTTINRVIAAYVPLRRPPQKPPWSNQTLRRLKRRKASAQRKYSNSRSPFFKSVYNHASSRYRSYNRLLYNRYVIRVQFDLRRNPKQFWSFVNSKRKVDSLPSTMILDDDIARTPLDKCTLLANHFKLAFNDRVASSQQVDEAVRSTPSDVFNCSITSVTILQVASAIRKLKLSYAAGPDGIPSSVLKRCSNALLLPLTWLFNISLRQCTFPTNWKSSYMFPVYKKGDKNYVRNYRGITSLCACSKVFEILVNDTLFACCRTYISTDQHGFFPKRSVATNLVQFVSHCLQHMDAGAQVDTVYTDLKAAFDRVDHNVLLKRIGKLGVSAPLVTWFKSYLTGRSLRVKIGNYESDAFSNASGVPQGSNLGPLLFILFVNELQTCLTRGCRLFYADDAKIFTVIRSVADCLELQRLIDLFDEWCTCNLLTLSIEKCNVISFHRKTKPIVFNYTISGTVLERVDHIKDLGIHLDRELTFRTHYHDIVTRANRQLGFIFKIADGFRDLACLRSLYCSLVRSILEFSAVVWCPFQAIWIARIESVQRKFTRLALRRTRSPAAMDSYEDRCRHLELDTLEQRRYVAQTQFVAKLLNGESDAPSILAKVHFYVPVRQLRQRAFLQLAPRNTVYGLYDPIQFMCSRFNDVYELFDFNVSTELFQHRVRTRLRQ